MSQATSSFPLPKQVAESAGPQQPRKRKAQDISHGNKLGQREQWQGLTAAKRAIADFTLEPEGYEPVLNKANVNVSVVGDGHVLAAQPLACTLDVDFGKVKNCRLLVGAAVTGSIKVSFNRDNSVVVVGQKCRLRNVEIRSEQAGDFIAVGANVEADDTVLHSGHLNVEAAIRPYIVIGDNCCISTGVHFRNTAAYQLVSKTGNSVNPSVRGICVGPRVCISEGATILEDVCIGAGSIVECRAVVTRDVPACSVASGVPATCSPLPKGAFWVPDSSQSAQSAATSFFERVAEASDVTDGTNNSYNSDMENARVSRDGSRTKSVSRQSVALITDGHGPRVINSTRLAGTTSPEVSRQRSIARARCAIRDLNLDSRDSVYQPVQPSDQVTFVRKTGSGAVYARGPLDPACRLDVKFAKSRNCVVLIGANVRGHIRIRFKQDGALVFVGDGCLLQSTLITSWQVGDFIAIGSNVLAPGKLALVSGALAGTACPHIIIGDGCFISAGAVMRNADGHPVLTKNGVQLNQPREGGGICLAPRCWIGPQVAVLKNTTVGEGAVVRHGSVLTRDVPPASLAHGVPIRSSPLPEGASLALPTKSLLTSEGQNGNQGSR
eukprot:INCI18356.1.p1 GENE.INCI18356.1~~INCI18356.1.p1  ORF type:complete len:609 (-),score=64.41 INCI18356.1:82-1908(-)